MTNTPIDFDDPAYFADQCSCGGDCICITSGNVPHISSQEREENEDKWS